MSTIYHSDAVDEKFLKQLGEELKKSFKGCKSIVVKMHFGELGNSKAFKPKDIEPITDLLTKLGFNHILFDSSVMYGGPRSNTVTHKLLAQTKGFKNVVTDDSFIEVKGKYLKYKVCKRLTDADGVLVLSHVKGHICTGFGGAIKNLGMGALAKESKIAIHKGGEPVFSGNCVKCGVCVHNCPINGMKIESGKPYPIVKSCYGCSNCSYECPNNIIHPKVAPFDVLLADGANSAQSKFKRYYYVSAIKNVTQQCDCMPMPGNIIAKDHGWLMGSDAVGIDQASYDIIIKNDGDVFLKYNKKKGDEQISAAEKLKMGKRKYVLKEL